MSSICSASLILNSNVVILDFFFFSWWVEQVKFSELTIDSFRMLQCLEWEPSGSFYQASGALSSGTSVGQSEAPVPSRGSSIQDITDPTLPPNPRKAILYRPSVTHFIAVSTYILNFFIIIVGFWEQKVYPSEYDLSKVYEFLLIM